METTRDPPQRRERKIRLLLYHGFNRHEIAKMLKYHIKTVQTHCVEFKRKYKESLQ